jgi:hypothetical protein
VIFHKIFFGEKWPKMAKNGKDEKKNKKGGIFFSTQNTPIQHKRRMKII